MSEESDEKLADLSRRGSRDAFAVLVTRFARRVFSLCLRMTGHRDDADDLTQEVFLRAYRSIDRFEPRRRFAPWLLSIAANACRNHLRDRASSIDDAVDLDEQRNEPVCEQPVDAPLILIEDAEAVRDAIATLPPLDRLAILLRFEQGLSLEETSLALEMPRARVAVRVHRARQRLRAELRRRAGDANRCH